MIHPARNQSLFQPDSRHCRVKISSRWNHIAVEILPMGIWNTIILIVVRSHMILIRQFVKTMKNYAGTEELTAVLLRTLIKKLRQANRKRQTENVYKK